ncbi:hypothetical protein CFP56_000915 [Quercus suber]|uniref:Uncharacterized protein n=1 Tax=Quercus suber TaxID=58331 RepID=A0AAW0IP58_QUESU
MSVIHFSRASFDDTPNFSPVKEKIAHFPLIQEHYGCLTYEAAHKSNIKFVNELQVQFTVQYTVSTTWDSNQIEREINWNHNLNVSTSVDWLYISPFTMHQSSLLISLVVFTKRPTC